MVPKSGFRYDPTRTKLIRAQMEKEVGRRFDLLKSISKAILNISGAVDLHLVDQLRQAQSRILLGSDYGTPLTEGVSKSWMNPYINAVYRKALTRAGGHVKTQGGRVSDRWTNQAHFDQAHVRGARTMQARAYTAMANIAGANDAAILRGLQENGLKTNIHINDEMDDVRDLVQAGIEGGRGVSEVARIIEDALGIGRERALTLARTETIATHAEATLNAFLEAGMAGVQVDAEFATAGDDQVCTECKELEGETYSIEEARGIIPVHPNCRCAWLPVVGDVTGELK